MPQKYKVYFASKPVVFLSATDDLQLTPDSEVIVSQGKSDTMLIESAIGRGARTIYIRCSDIERSWRLFSAQFDEIKAAGGVVFNELNEVLFIFRLEKWDLPKGKVEEGEELELAALREVEEECSIGDLELTQHLVTTYHTYTIKGLQVLKSTDWYVMKHHGNTTPQPQTAEGITEAKWISHRDWAMVEENTFPSVRDVLRAYESSLLK